MEGKKRALIVAVSDYLHLQSLDFCRNDGEQMFNLLNSLGFEIYEGEKLIGFVEWGKMREAIIKFFTNEDIKSKDILLFYFSGHGIPDGYGDNYLGTSEVEPNMPYRKGYSFDEFTKMMQRSLSTRIVAILDCCYSGAAKISKGGEQDAARIGTAVMREKSHSLEQGEGRYLLASSQPLQQAFEFEEANQSLFTHFLLEGLHGAEGESVDKDGRVTLDSLSKYVYHKVTELLPNQRPIRKVEGSGDIVLAYYPQFKEKVFDEMRINSPSHLSSNYSQGSRKIDEKINEEKLSDESRIKGYIESKKKNGRRFTYSDCARDLGIDIDEVIKTLSKL